MATRAVIGARVSAMIGDGKLSHIDQHESGMRHARLRGWQVVGSFEDLDVSAIEHTPWERPELAEWLTTRAHDFDALVFTKTDRALRSARDAANLADWAEKNHKILAFADDGIQVDYFTPPEQRDSFASMMAEIFLMMASMFAQIEGRRYVTRAQSRVRSLRKTDRWGYGIPPFGYQVVDHPSGEGKALDFDPDAQQILHKRLAKPLLDRWSLTGIVTDLNNSGIPSPRDHLRIRKGESPRGNQWTTEKMAKILKSPATMGIKVENGKPALDSEGQPIRVGPPSFDRDTWEQIQTALAERSYKPKKRVHSVNPLLGVAKCGSCKGNLSQRSRTTPKGVTHRYYVCGKTPRPCPKISIIASEAEELIEQQFLEMVGHRYVQRQEFSPGEDVSYELADVEATIEDLRQDRKDGLFRTDEDKQVYREQMQSLLDKRDELKEKPYRPAGWVSVEADYTYADSWSTSDTSERRELLRDAGVTLTVHGPQRYEIYVPLDRIAEKFGAEPSDMEGSETS